MHYLNTDGGARGNPGPAAAAYILKKQEKSEGYEFEEVEKGGEYLGEATNNIAEYRGLIFGLTAAIKRGVSELTCFLDSELVVKQLLGEYRVKDEKMKKLFAEVESLRKQFKSVTFKHVLRAENKEADKMVNDILDSR